MSRLILRQIAPLLLFLFALVASCQVSKPVDTQKTTLLSFLEPTYSTPIPVASLPAYSKATPAASVNPKAETSATLPKHFAFTAGESNFRHPQGLFEFSLPEGWIVVEQPDGLAELTASSSPAGILYISTTNTGNALNQKTLIRFVDAREANYFASFPGYQSMEREHGQASRPTETLKKLVWDGKEQFVVSLYHFEQQCVLSADLWLDQPPSDTLINHFIEFFGGIRAFPDIISRQPVYQWMYTFSFHDLFSVQLPLHWTMEGSRSGNSEVIRLTAPTLDGAIQFIVFEDEKQPQAGSAGFITREILRSFYGQGIDYLDDRVLPGWSERLTWISEDRTIQGVTFRENIDKRTILLSFTWDAEKEEIYQNLFNVVAASYLAFDSQY